jgi:hypothetical protein
LARTATSEPRGQCAGGEPDPIIESVDNEGTRAQAQIFEAALKREAAYVQTISHDIAFFGQIGVGKTTALSASTGLMLPPAPDERTIKRTVLEVGELFWRFGRLTNAW